MESTIRNARHERRAARGRTALLMLLVFWPPPPAHAADWQVSINPLVVGEPVSTALLGHYDLSGALFGYDAQPGLVSAMQAIGFSEWRVGVGRWEAGTWLLPMLTDGTPCPIFWPASAAPAGLDDLDLIAARDWFSDDGAPVGLVETEDDARYRLDYLRSVLEVAEAFGAKPFVSIDAMPRALSAGGAPERTDCGWSFQNRISNVRPEAAAVFAAAVAALVERIVEGSDGLPGRPVTHWEVWNEPEFGQFWDPAFEDGVGPLDRYFEMAIQTLVALDAYRAASTHPDAAELVFGLGSFATAGVAVATIAGFDAATLPNGAAIPIDFVSFHAYSDDPLGVVAVIENVAAAAAGSSRYRDVELVLGEWGPSLESSAGDPVFAASMDSALHVATVLALGATAGLDRAHRSIFWDFYPNSLQLGLLDNGLNAKPAYRAYQLLSQLLLEGAGRQAALGQPNGRLEGGAGALLATVDGSGRHRVLLVNRGAVDRTVCVRFAEACAIPDRVQRYADAAAPIELTIGGAPEEMLPARSLLLLEFDPIPVPAPGPSSGAAWIGMLCLAVGRARLDRPRRSARQRPA